MKVSILIGSRDRVEVLTRCLRSVLAQDFEFLEVVVLDDNSIQYRLDELLVARFKDDRLRCLRVDKSLGVGGGRNFLMQQATGDLFCFIDDDAYFETNSAITQLVDGFKQHTNVGIIAVKVIDHYQPDRSRLFVPFTQRQLKKNPRLIAELQYVSYYLGTCHIIRRKVIDVCYGYQNNTKYGEEELDLSYRAIEAGFEIMYLPDVVVHHFPKPSVVDQRQGQRDTELFHHICNRFFLAYKYLPRIYIPVYLTIWLGRYGARALKRQAIREFWRGLVAGVKLLKHVERTPLSQKAVRYLKANYGRLWY